MKTTKKKLFLFATTVLLTTTQLAVGQTTNNILLWDGAAPDDANMIQNAGNIMVNNAFGVAAPTSAFEINGDLNLTVPGGSTLNRHYRMFGVPILSTIGSSNLVIGRTDAYTAIVSNSGTNDAIDNVFIGENAGNLNTTGDANVSIGSGSGEYNITTSRNTYIGYNSGRFATGDNNTRIGHVAGQGTFSGAPLNESIQNTTVGSYAEYLNRSGNQNVSIGMYSNYEMDEGDENTAVGHSSLKGNKDGNYNVAVGRKAGENMIDNSGNIFIGYLADVSNNTINTDNSTAIGSNSKISLDNSSNATAIGFNSIANCSSCMVLGNGSASSAYKVGIGTTNPTGNFHIADMASGTAGSSDVRFEDLPASIGANNKVLVATSSTGQVYWKNLSDFSSNSCATNYSVPYYSTTSSSLVCGTIQDNGSSIGVGTSAGGTWTYSGGEALISGGPSSPSPVMLDVNGLTRTTYLVVMSDREAKREIKAIETPLQKILKLNGVSYKMKSNPTSKSINTFNDKLDFGFIAQDVEKVIAEVVGKDANNIYGINYLMIIPILTESIKELNDQKSELQKRVDALESKVDELNSKVQQCCDQKEGFPTINQPRKNILFQNVPNPFKENTTFSYELQNKSNFVYLKIFSLNGDLLQTLSQSSSDQGEFEFSAGNLKSGTYLCVLMADGQTVDTKYFSLLKD